MPNPMPPFPPLERLDSPIIGLHHDNHSHTKVAHGSLKYRRANPKLPSHGGCYVQSVHPTSSCRSSHAQHGHGGHGPAGLERLQPEEIPAINVLATLAEVQLATLTRDRTGGLGGLQHANVP